MEQQELKAGSFYLARNNTLHYVAAIFTESTYEYPLGFAAVSSQVQRSNQQLDTQIDTLLTTVYGADKSKINDESYALVANPQKDNKEAAMLDPICIAQRIKDLSDEISSIKTELDFVLSESNARTEIEV